MTRLRITLCSSLAAVALLAGAANAADQATNIDENAVADDAQIAAMQNMALAQRLAAIGQETGDPLMLIAAARLAGQVAIAESTVTPRDPAEAPGGGSAAMHTPAEMLDAARALAGDRPDILALIDDAAAEGSRGSLYGSGAYEDYIPGYTNIYYDEAFYGGEQAVIELTGHDPSDIDLWVYDEYGNLICSSTSYSSYESCAFVPRWTGQFTIRVENEGHSRGTYYTLWTN